MFSAFLHQHGDNNLRVATRRVANEPGVVLEFFLFPKPFSGRITDNLRGSGFASDFDSGETDVARSAAFFVDNAVHRVGYFLHGRLGKREPLLAHVRRVFQEMGLLKDAPHGDAADHARELQRGGDDSALASGYGNRFTGIPLAMKHALDPFRGRHQPGLLRG